MIRGCVVLLALVVGGCTYDKNVGVLSTQRLTADGTKPVTLRATGFTHVNVLDQTTDRNLYDGTVAGGDDVVLDPAAHLVRVRGLVVNTGLHPGDRVQVSLGGP